MKFKILTVAAAAVLGVSAAGVNALALEDSWNMETNGSVVQESGGSNRDINLNGDYTTTANAVIWNSAPAWGEVVNSASKDPGTQKVAIGAKVTVTNIPSGSSGNVIQKGFFGSPGQIKLQTLPDNGGEFSCRVKGTNGADFVYNTRVTNVDDGVSHTAFCYRDGNTIGLEVDGLDVSKTFNPGSIDPGLNIFLGNKGSGGDASDQHFGKNLCSAYAYGTSAPIAYVRNTLENTC